MTVDDPSGAPRRQGTSPWVWIGCGCGLLVALALAGVVALTWWGYRKAQEFEAGMTDPTAREERVRGLLPYDELPAGYYPMGGLSIPFLMDIAFLTDEETPAGDGELQIDERALIYLVVRDWRDQEAELGRYLEGKGARPDWMGQSGVGIDEGEVLRRGTVEVGDLPVRYVAHRGEIEVDKERREGIVTLFLVDCPGDDRRLRIGVWFGPDPAPGEPGGSPAYAGTPADPEALRAFASHFRFCSGQS